MPALTAVEAGEIASFKQQWREVVAELGDQLPSIEEQRSGFDAMNAEIPLPPGCAVTADPWGIAGEWIVPQGADETRVLLYIHGGGHFFGNPACYRHLVARIAEAAGVSAIVPQYRLAPEHPFPAAIEDATEAYRQLLAQGFGPESIVVAGDSAGGNLAAALLVTLRAEGLAQPAGLYLISPWLDLTLSGEAYQARAAHDPLLTRDAMARAARLYVPQAATADPLASPIRRPDGPAADANPGRLRRNLADRRNNVRGSRGPAWRGCHIVHLAGNGPRLAIISSSAGGRAKGDRGSGQLDRRPIGRRGNCCRLRGDGA